MNAQNRPFLCSLHYFRSFAIISIVLGHSMELVFYDFITSFWGRILASLVRNATVYFVFISGYLFHHIYSHSFNYTAFLKKRLLYVFIPYLFFALPCTLFLVFLLDGGRYLPDNFRGHSLSAILWYLYSGRMYIAYWFIPMAMCLYFASPIVIELLEDKKVWLICVCALCVSVFVHRPAINLNPIHAFFYFFPVYLFGAYCSKIRSLLLGFFQKKQVFLLLFALVLILIQGEFCTQTDGFYKKSADVFLFSGIDINLIQKLSLCIFFLIQLNSWKRNQFPILERIAEMSFPIYCIHPLLIQTLKPILVLTNSQAIGTMAIILGAFLFLTIFSMTISYGLKMVLGKDSKFIIGW